MGNSAAYWIGGIAGAALLITILAALLEKLIFQRVFDDPVRGKMSAVVTAWLAAGIIFGFWNGGPFEWRFFGLYFIPASLVGLWFYHRGTRLREEMGLEEASGEELGRSFE